MKFKNFILIFIQIVVIILSIVSFLFFYEIQKGVYMLNFIMLGFIIKLLLEIRKSKNDALDKKLPQNKSLVILLFIIALIAFIIFGINVNSYVFVISLICGLVGLFILIYITKYIHDD